MRKLALAALSALIFGSSTSAQAFFLLLGAANEKHREPENTAKPRGPFLTEERLAREAVKQPATPPVFVFPMDKGMMLAQSGQSGEPTREVPFWRIELHPPNQGARLTDPTEVVFARPGQITALFRTELPRAAAQQLDIHTYRMTGLFRVTETGSHSFASRFKCTWNCNLTMKVAGQEVIRITDFVGILGAADRIERFNTTLPVGEYPIEVVFGFPRPQMADSTYASQSGVPRLDVLMRRPSDETLVPIEIFSRIPASRAAVPVPMK